VSLIVTVVDDEQRSRLDELDIVQSHIDGHPDMRWSPMPVVDAASSSDERVLDRQTSSPFLITEVAKAHAVGLASFISSGGLVGLDLRASIGSDLSDAHLGSGDFESSAREPRRGCDDGDPRQAEDGSPGETADDGVCIKSVTRLIEPDG
jgi:hypothetical protein